MNALVKILCGLFCMLSAGLALSGNEPDPALHAASKVQFADQAAAIRVQMRPGGHWEFVSRDERNTIERRLAQIADLLNDVAAVDLLSADRKADLLTAQEEINAILSGKDGRRVICEKIAPTGSHRKQQQCETFAQREHERRQSQKYLRDHATHPEL